MATIRIENLRLRAIVGINDWERTTPQDVIINIRFTFDARAAAASDAIEDTCDYKTLNKRIITLVEASSDFLVEKLAARLLALVHEDPRVQHAWVRVEKPGALRYADSVSLELCSDDR